MRDEEFSAVKFRDDELIECYNKLATPRACWLCERLKAEVCEPKRVVPIDCERGNGGRLKQYPLGLISKAQVPSDS